MSHWTHVLGAVRVSPMGRTQPEKRYVLDTVLEHLPRVTGSEGDMEVWVTQGGGGEESCSCDEFDMRTDKATDWYGNRDRRHGMHRMDSDYLLTLSGNLRDREFDETFKELQRWLIRLAKRVPIYDLCIKLYAEYGNKTYVIDNGDSYFDMWEVPSWGKPDEEPNWCEYLMWKRWKDTPLPLEHIYKYYNDEEADEDVKEYYNRRKGNNK